MIKIYNATTTFGNINIDDSICFDKNGRYETGAHGFGTIINPNDKIKEANYELATLDGYCKYLHSLNTRDGFVDYQLLAPLDYNLLKKEYADIEKNEDNLEKYCLNEEGILLLTENVVLSHYDNKVYRLYGRYPETALYIIKPNASFIMRPCDSESFEENYEVLQSNNLGKRLVLSKMNREI